jgi:hypothetical protein
MPLVLFHVLLSRIASITIHNDRYGAWYLASFEDSDEEPLVPGHRHIVM